MVLSGHELLPIVHGISAQVRTRVPDEVAKNVLLELCLRVRWVRAPQPVQTREQWLGGVRAAAIDTGVATTAGDSVRLGRSHPVHKLAKAVNHDRAHTHALSLEKSVAVWHTLPAWQGRTKHTRATGLREYPRPVLPRRLMAHVNCVSTLELRDPVALIVLVKANDPSLGLSG